MDKIRNRRTRRRVTAMVLPALLIAGAVLAYGQPAGAVEAARTAPAIGQRALAAAAVPGAPTLDQLTPGDGEIQVNWSFGNPNLGVTGYTATAQPSGDHCDVPGRFSTQCTITGLTNGVPYTVTVVAHHLSDGDSAPSNSRTATPGRSIAVSVANPSERRVDVYWDLKSIDAPQQFVVTIDSDPERRCTAAGTDTGCTVNLVPFGTHSVRVTAVFADPTRNLTSEPESVTLTTPPMNVTVTGVAVSGHDATVSWSYSGGSDRFQAILFTDPGQTCEYGLASAVNGLGCTFEDLPYGTYRVQVDAYGEGLEATSQIFTFVVAPPAPATPDEVTAVSGVSSVIASWSAPTDSVVPITGYRAMASPGPASCTTTGETTCVIGGTAGQAYTITVVALSAGGGESAPSEPSNSATPSLPVPTDNPPSTDLKLTTDKGRINTAQPGQDIVFIGRGFADYSTVVITIYSHQILGTDEANGDGVFRKRVTIPSNLAAGWHTVVALGIAPDGTTRAMAISIEFLGLAVTGADVATVLLVGFAMIGAGAAAYAITRRRSRRLRFVA